MTLANRIGNVIIKGLMHISCKLDVKELQKVPKNGPIIIMANHVSFMEAPILYLFMQPRRTIALGKTELWESAVTRTLMNWWECIPVKRGEIDMKSIKECFAVLDKGDFLCIAPEGTRSPKGTLNRGQAGTSFIAIKQQVPMLPVVHIGLENFSKNIKKLKRTPVKICVGKPFTLILGKKRFNSEERQDITDEMMRRMAALLPVENQGFYADTMHLPWKYTQEQDTV
ncbi:MAG: 1-acyl-sn-glycerol-3-phosphate acyltransferase [Bacteroidetes bacterium]|nr:1-acyl-sn-glycerol-3-phosphate acyltransferase [Bacteroidota bacterium]